MRRRLSSPLLTAWCVACLTALALLIGARWLRYSNLPVGPEVDRILREVMVLESQWFLWPWAYARFEASTIALAVGVLVIGLHRRLPGMLVHLVDGAWHLRPAIVALVCGGMVSLHYLFDVNPAVTRVCVESLILLAITSRAGIGARLPRGLRLGLWGAALAYWLVGAGDVIDRLTIATWAAFLFATERWLVGRVGGTDLALLRLAMIAPTNLLSAMLPLLLPLHGGTHLGDGLAYSFCETPDHQRLYAAIPVCDSVWADYAHCRDGAVAEYDLSTMTRSATHRFFTPDYYGRLEMLLCLDDEVLATVHGAIDHGRPLKEAVLSFPYDTPGAFNPLYAERTGATIAYDAAHDAVFTSAEFDARIVRYDRRAKRTDEITDLRHEFFEPITLAASTGSHSLDTRSVHPGRNRLYLTEVMQGRYTYALDLTTLDIVARYENGGGGAFGVAVDPERDRLFVSSLWGLEVFDLKTDQLITRIRTGLGNRPVIVDAARNRLYLSSMVEGKIRVLDRDTLADIGQIPIGIGSRFAHLSGDAKRFFASSLGAHYYWDADTMVPRP